MKLLEMDLWKLTFGFRLRITFGNSWIWTPDLWIWNRTRYHQANATTKSTIKLNIINYSRVFPLRPISIASFYGWVQPMGTDQLAKWERFRCTNWNGTVYQLEKISNNWRCQTLLHRERFCLNNGTGSVSNLVSFAKRLRRNQLKW